MGNALENPAPGFEETLAEVVFAKKFADAIRYLFPPRAPFVEVLTMREVVRYLVEERPPGLRIDHGILLDISES